MEFLILLFIEGVLFKFFLEPSCQIMDWLLVNEHDRPWDKCIPVAIGTFILASIFSMSIVLSLALMIK